MISVGPIENYPHERVIGLPDKCICGPETALWEMINEVLAVLSAIRKLARNCVRGDHIGLCALVNGVSDHVLEGDFWTGSPSVRLSPVTALYFVWRIGRRRVRG